jgi:hypothetical protein
MQVPESLLCSALRGETPHWPASEDATFKSHFLERATYHGVLPLLHHLLNTEQAIAQGWPHDVLEECHRQAIGRAMWELRHQHLLTNLLAEMVVKGVTPILIKGTALAYGIYPSPVMRSRADTDLIVPAAQWRTAAEILEALGFIAEEGISGEFFSHQHSFTMVDSGGTRFTVDLHWRISTSATLGKLFTYEELADFAKPLPALGPHTLGVQSVGALLLACMHLITERPDTDNPEGKKAYVGKRLIWLYDLHLLLSSLSVEQQNEVVSLAREKGLRAVCLDAILQAQACLGTDIPDELYAPLSRRGPVELPARYMKAGRYQRVLMDILAMDGLATKARFLLPPEAFMRQKYPDAPQVWLPLLYLRRAAGGVIKRLTGRAG